MVPIPSIACRPSPTGWLSGGSGPGYAVWAPTQAVTQAYRLWPIANRLSPFGRQTPERRCPSFSFFVFKYRRVVSDTAISSGSHSDTERP
jgi:hypothetical protein